MKRMILILALLLPLTTLAQSPHPATNYLVVAEQNGTNGWIVQAFDVDWQLQRGATTNKLTPARFAALTNQIAALTPTQKRAAVKLACNRYLNRPSTWEPMPGSTNIVSLTDLRIGMGGDIARVKQQIGVP